MTNLEKLIGELFGDIDRAVDTLDENACLCDEVFCEWGRKRGMCTADKDDGSQVVDLSDCRRCIRGWLEDEAPEVRA